MTCHLRYSLPAIALACWLAAAPAHGSLVVTVGDVTLMQGETDIVEVMIRSDGTDFLQAFGIRLQLDTTLSGNLLQFGNPPSNTELQLPFYAGFVFFGDSDAAANGSTASVIPISTTNDTYDGADLTLSGNNVMLTMLDRLVVRVDVTALSGAPAGMYNVNFIDGSSSFFNAAGDPLDFTATGGVVTVLPAANGEVPEPGGLAVSGAGLAVAAVLRTGRRFRQRR